MIKDSESKPVTAMLASEPGEFAIEVHSLSKTYSEGIIAKKKFQALSDVSFNVNRGEIFGLLGPNGAGKTTFIKILLGIISKTAGEATMLGQQAGSRAGRKLVGYLPEHLRIPPHLNGYTALECYGSLSNVPKSVIRAKRDGLLDLVGLTGRARDRCKKYSKGMLQRLGLAQALLHDPQMLILDEPTDGLDPQARAEMRQLIRRLKDDGKTVFLNSHLLQEVEMICDRVAILDRGRLMYCGNVSTIGDFVSASLGVTDSGLMIEVDVVGDPTSINEAFADHQFEIVSNKDGEAFSVRLSLADQAAIDRLVDSLRAKDVSIQRLLRKQGSLEDAFLQIIADHSPSGNVDSRIDQFLK